MIDNCQESAEHHFELRKNSPFWGTYQLKNINIKEMKNLKICGKHMDMEHTRHPWAFTSNAKLTIEEKQCYLCKKNKLCTNTTRHCLKHMISVAGESYHVPCDLFDIMEGNFTHSRHKSNHFICHSCKGTYEEIHELEKQHQKYLQMITTIKPAVPHRRQKVEKPSSEVKSERSIDSSLQKLNLYAVYYLQNPYQQWEIHIHNENEVSILRWDKSTCRAARRMTITSNDDAEYLLKFQVWGKNIDSIPCVPLKSEYFHSSINEFHQDVVTYLTELDNVQFCEGCYDANVVKGLENMPLSNAIIDQNQFMTESGTTDSTVRSTACTFQAQASTNRCMHCSTLYRSTLRKRLDRQKQGTEVKQHRKDATSKCPLVALQHNDLLSRSRALATVLNLQKKQKSYWYTRYTLLKKEERIQMPKKLTNYLTSHNFETLISEAIKAGELTEKSILYCILLDTLSVLQNKPTAVHYSQSVIKWCVSLSNKIHCRGYEALREALPLPCWTTLQSYRFNTRSTNPICEDNMTQFKNVLEVSGCKGIGGIHWDEIYIKKGVIVCKRTKELV